MAMLSRRTAGLVLMVCVCCLCGCDKWDERITSEKFRFRMFGFHPEVIEAVNLQLDAATPQSVGDPVLAAATWGGSLQDGEVSVVWWWIESPPRLSNVLITNQATGGHWLFEVSEEEVESFNEMGDHRALTHWWATRVPLAFFGDADIGDIRVSFPEHDAEVQAIKVLRSERAEP